MRQNSRTEPSGWRTLTVTSLKPGNGVRGAVSPVVARVVTVAIDAVVGTGVSVGGRTSGTRVVAGAVDDPPVTAVAVAELDEFDEQPASASAAANTNRRRITPSS